MNRSLCLFSILFLFTASVNIFGEDPEPVGTNQRLRRGTVVLDIDARVLEQKNVVIWEETHRKLTIPGSPVGIKLVGSNLVVAAQFTPFIRRRGNNVLVAQGQIWIDNPKEGVRYYTSIQTIPLEFDEPIYFFPLGQSSQLDSFIEIMLTVKPYAESDAALPETSANTEN
ncbi:MAG: hypothetical protein LBU82_01535 [Treponema sp.]|jgi:hypothetical protein|nr:hypothetical protein [Treponema sp.]